MPTTSRGLPLCRPRAELGEAGDGDVESCPRTSARSGCALSAGWHNAPGMKRRTRNAQEIAADHPDCAEPSRNTPAVTRRAGRVVSRAQPHHQLGCGRTLSYASAASRRVA